MYCYLCRYGCSERIGLSLILLKKIKDRPVIKAVCNHWTGLVDWTTGLTFDLKYSQKTCAFVCKMCFTCSLRVIAISYKTI